MQRRRAACETDCAFTAAQPALLGLLGRSVSISSSCRTLNAFSFSCFAQHPASDIHIRNNAICGNFWNVVNGQAALELAGGRGNWLGTADPTLARWGVHDLHTTNDVTTPHAPYAVTLEPGLAQAPPPGVVKNATLCTAPTAGAVELPNVVIAQPTTIAAGSVVDLSKPRVYLHSAPLVVEAGVTFQGHAPLVVYADATLLGNESAPIVASCLPSICFSPFLSTGFLGTRPADFAGDNATVTLRHVHVSGPYRHMVQTKANFLPFHLRVFDSTFSGASSIAVTAHYEATVHRSRFLHGAGVGFFPSRTHDIDIDGCYFEGNVVGYSSSQRAHLRLTNSVFVDNEFAIQLSQDRFEGFDVLIEGNVIVRSSRAAVHAGWAVGGWQAMLRGNAFVDNEAVVVTTIGTGIRDSTGGTSSVLSTVFVQNDFCFSSEAARRPIAFDFSGAALVAGEANPLRANVTDNFWGSSNLDVVATTVVDHKYDVQWVTADLAPLAAARHNPTLLMPDGTLVGALPCLPPAKANTTAFCIDSPSAGSLAEAARLVLDPAKTASVADAPAGPDGQPRLSVQCTSGHSVVGIAPAASQGVVDVDVTCSYSTTTGSWIWSGPSPPFCKPPLPPARTAIPGAVAQADMSGSLLVAVKQPSSGVFFGADGDVFVQRASTAPGAMATRGDLHVNGHSVQQTLEFLLAAHDAVNARLDAVTASVDAVSARLDAMQPTPSST